MKALGLFLLTAIFAQAAPSHGEPSEAIFKYHKEIEFKLLRVTPEDFENKKVTYNGRFIGLTAQFHNYMVESGLKPDRYLGIGVGDLAIPVFVRKQGDIAEFLAGVKPGCTVQVYGRVRDFRRKPPTALLPKFYLDLEHITVLSEPADVGKALQDLGNKIRQSIEQKKQERANPIQKKPLKRRVK
jgi:hypothetical protein